MELYCFISPETTTKLQNSPLNTTFNACSFLNLQQFFLYDTLYVVNVMIVHFLTKVITANSVLLL